jgi:uncharacterized protein (TIGR03905 family)
MHNYTPRGVCAKKLQFEVRDGLLTNVVFEGGCNGNLQGISRLAEGMTPNDAADRLMGIQCGSRGTSCPDQLSKALHEWMKLNP